MVRNPLPLQRPLFWSNCGAQSLQWQSEQDSSLTAIKPQCQPGLGVQLPGRGNLGKGENEDASSPLFPTAVAHPSFARNSGCTSSTRICPTCKAISDTKHVIGVPGTQQCFPCFRRRWEEDTSLMPSGISSRYPSGHPALCHEPAASWWLQDCCLLTQSRWRSVHQAHNTYNSGVGI